MEVKNRLLNGIQNTNDVLRRLPQAHCLFQTCYSEASNVSDNFLLVVLDRDKHSFLVQVPDDERPWLWTSADVISTTVLGRERISSTIGWLAYLAIATV